MLLRNISRKLLNIKLYINNEKHFKNFNNGKLSFFYHKRFFSSSTTDNSFVAIKLTNKGLLRIRGPESLIYLQSLLTNDMRKLLSNRELSPNDVIESPNQTVIYAYFLSAVGKVLCDTFVYKGRHLSDGEYILEIDRKLINAVKRLLLGYNTNRTINVEIVNDIDLWSIIPLPVYQHNHSVEFNEEYYENLNTLETIDSDDIKLASDPRLGHEYLGYRFMTRLGGKNIEDIGKFIRNQSNSGKTIKLIEGQIVDYKHLKYRLGISEGYEDILSGFYFPFELNGDFLNAICLNKGLYTSEEKMVEIYSSTPIKRRIFPVEFKCSLNTLHHKNPAPRTLISAPGFRRFGELRNRIGRFGIASLYVPIENNFGVKSLFRRQVRHDDSGLPLKVTIPNWWPRNFDQIYLEVPDYPKCLFNFTNSSSVVIENQQPTNQISY